MPRNEHKKVLQQLSEAYQTVRQQEVIEEIGMIKAGKLATKFLKRALSSGNKRRAQRFDKKIQQKADKDAYLQYDRLGAAEKAAAAGKISNKTAGALAGAGGVGAGIGMKKMQDAVDSAKQAANQVEHQLDGRPIPAPKPAPTPVAPVSDEEGTGKRYQVLAIGGEHGQNSYLEAEFDDLNEVEMYLASELDRHGVDIDDWKQGDSSGFNDLFDRKRSRWEREEGSDHLYLPIQGADGDDVYEVIDTHSDTIDDFNKEENRREFAKMDFDEVEDAEHVFKNTEAGYEREDFKHKYSERVRAVNLAMQALKQFNDNIKHEDLDVEALADAHDQLSRALHWLVDEKAVERIMGGRATERSYAQSKPEQFYTP